MRVILVLLVGVFFSTLIGFAASDNPVRPTPVIRMVDPPAAKCGVEVVATGEHLDKDIVESLYLTVGEAVTKVEILKQSGSSISFKLPEKTTRGRYGLMVLTAGFQPHYIDEPVSVNVE